MTDQLYVNADHGQIVEGTNLAKPDYAISSAWSKAKDFKKPFTYRLEKSEQNVLLHRLDMGDLLKLGIADEMDFMSKALLTAEVTDEKKAGDAVAEAVGKSKNFGKMEKMINSVVKVGVIEPKLQAVPLHEAARQPGQMYVDEIPWDDRMELFGVIFETEGLTDFREEQDAGVADVEHVTSVSLPADRPVDIRSDDA
jgi:hypothetical protein